MGKKRVNKSITNTRFNLAQISHDSSSYTYSSKYVLAEALLTFTIQNGALPSALNKSCTVHGTVGNCFSQKLFPNFM